MRKSLEYLGHTAINHDRWDNHFWEIAIPKYMFRLSQEHYFLNKRNSAWFYSIDEINRDKLSKYRLV